MDALNELKIYMRRLPSGPVLEVAVVEYLLIHCWDLLESSDDTSMEGYKLIDRTEGLSWNPPYLNFDLERHGGVALGGKVAEVHSWRVNVEEGTANIVGTKDRHLVPFEKSLNVKDLAKELTLLIAQGAEDYRLKWGGDEVRVLIGKAIPVNGITKPTISGRRKRFKTAMEQEISNIGWEPAPNKAHHTYRRSKGK